MHLQTVAGYNLVFERIGHMATAVNYVHARVSVDIAAINTTIHGARMAVEKIILEAEDELKSLNATNDYYNKNGQMIVTVAQHMQTVALFATEVEELQERWNNLRQLLPKIPTRRIITDDPEIIFRNGTLHSRQKRAFPVFGILGTLMGLFSQGQLASLENRLGKVVEQHNLLVEVVKKQDQRIVKLTNDLLLTKNALSYLQKYNSHNLLAPVRRLVSLVKRSLDQAFALYQQAQIRRLAADYLSSRQIDLLFQDLQQQAKETASSLLISQPSDLLQLETSYLFDGQQLNLLIHIPMVPQFSLMRMFKLHPFPIRISANYSVIPEVDDQIIAVTSSDPTYHIQFHAADLLGCQSVNQVHICQRHGVLNKQPNTTCLGSIYAQDLDSAMQLCPMKIARAGEVIHALLDNYYLVYLPEPHTLPIRCLNGSFSEMLLTQGIHRIHLSPTCQAKFKHHLVIADTSIRTDNDLQHLQHPDTKLKVLDLSEHQLEHRITTLMESGISRPTVQDLLSFNYHAQMQQQLTNSHQSLTNQFQQLLAAQHQLIRTTDQLQDKTKTLDTVDQELHHKNTLLAQELNSIGPDMLSPIHFTPNDTTNRNFNISIALIVVLFLVIALIIFCFAKMNFKYSRPINNMIRRLGMDQPMEPIQGPQAAAQAPMYPGLPA